LSSLAEAAGRTTCARGEVAEGVATLTGVAEPLRLIGGVDRGVAGDHGATGILSRVTRRRGRQAQLPVERAIRADLRMRNLLVVCTRRMAGWLTLQARPSMLTEPFSQYNFARLVRVLGRWACEVRPVAAVTRFRLALWLSCRIRSVKTLAVVGVNLVATICRQNDNLTFWLSARCRRKNDIVFGTDGFSRGRGAGGDA
jgi:hypothetical protein